MVRGKEKVEVGCGKRKRQELQETARKLDTLIASRNHYCDRRRIEVELIFTAVYP